MTETRGYTFVLKLTDRPGAMELIAATFAHRGLSLSHTLGNDGSLDPDKHATVLVHFAATPVRKEALKCTLSRLSRVVSLHEHASDDNTVRQTALIRLASGSPSPYLPLSSGQVQVLDTNKETGETTYALLGTLPAVTTLLADLHQQGVLRAVTQTVLAL